MNDWNSNSSYNDVHKTNFGNPINTNTMYNDDTELFVKNIPLEWTEYELKNLFQKYGKVRKVKLRLAKTPESLNFGFIDYDTEVSCEDAISNLNKKFLPDHPEIRLQVQYSNSKNQSKYQENHSTGGSENNNHYSDALTFASSDESRKRNMLLRTQTMDTKVFYYKNCQPEDILQKMNLENPSETPSRQQRPMHSVMQSAIVDPSRINQTNGNMDISRFKTQYSMDTGTQLPSLNVNNCFNCMKPALFTSTCCGQALYCSEACLLGDWVRHRRYCPNYMPEFSHTPANMKGNVFPISNQQFLQIPFRPSPTAGGDNNYDINGGYHNPIPLECQRIVSEDKRSNNISNPYPNLRISVPNNEYSRATGDHARNQPSNGFHGGNFSSAPRFANNSQDNRSSVDVEPGDGFGGRYGRNAPARFSNSHDDRTSVDIDLTDVESGFPKRNMFGGKVTNNYKGSSRDTGYGGNKPSSYNDNNNQRYDRDKKPYEERRPSRETPRENTNSGGGWGSSSWGSSKSGGFTSKTEENYSRPRESTTSATNNNGGGWGSSSWEQSASTKPADVSSKADENSSSWSSSWEQTAPIKSADATPRADENSFSSSSGWGSENVSNKPQAATNTILEEPGWDQEFSSSDTKNNNFSSIASTTMLNVNQWEQTQDFSSTIEAKTDDILSNSSTPTPKSPQNTLEQNQESSTGDEFKSSNLKPNDNGWKQKLVFAINFNDKPSSTTLNDNGWDQKLDYHQTEAQIEVPSTISFNNNEVHNMTNGWNTEQDQDNNTTSDEKPWTLELTHENVKFSPPTTSTNQKEAVCYDEISLMFPDYSGKQKSKSLAAISGSQSSATIEEKAMQIIGDYLGSNSPLLNHQSENAWNGGLSVSESCIGDKLIDFSQTTVEPPFNSITKLTDPDFQNVNSFGSEINHDQVVKTIGDNNATSFDWPF